MADEIQFTPLNEMTVMPSKVASAVVPEGMRREIITLDEGDVVITFPDGLTLESFGDLKDHLDLFIKKMQRRSQAKKDEIV